GVRTRGDASTDGPAAIVYAIGDLGPAVVPAWLRQVQLVAASRTVFHRPQPSLVVQRSGLHVPMAQAPDFGLGAFDLHEWVVRQRLAVLVDAEYLAEAAGNVLCLGPHSGVRPFAHGDEQCTLRREYEARAKVGAARVGRRLAENDFDVVQAAAAIFVQHQCCRGYRCSIAALPRLGEREEDAVAGLEVG